jgi:hypothetical protein
MNSEIHTHTHLKHKSIWNLSRVIILLQHQFVMINIQFK